MKGLKFTNKLIYLVNSIVAFLLFVSYVLPFLEPKTFSLLSVLSLGVPVLIIINFLFLMYWLIKLKKQVLLSLIVLLLGYFYFGSFYKFSSNKIEEEKDALTVMNFNVRVFNLYKWINTESIDEQISKFIKSKSPDILCIQEYYPKHEVDFSSYNYKYIELSGKKKKIGQAIYSKYPIVKSGAIKFPKTFNNAIYTDIVKGIDTIRVYNIHLQSLRIDSNVNNLFQENSEKLFKGVGQTFKLQQFQSELFLNHKKNSPYKMIVCGDFNNSAFSYVYNKIKGDLKDTFKNAGSGFGSTYNFNLFPVRIDFILVDDDFKVNGFETYKEKLSDHYPIMTSLSLKK